MDFEDEEKELRVKTTVKQEEEQSFLKPSNDFESSGFDYGSDPLGEDNPYAMMAQLQVEEHNSAVE